MTQKAGVGTKQVFTGRLKCFVRRFHPLQHCRANKHNHLLFAVFNPFINLVFFFLFALGIIERKLKERIFLIEGCFHPRKEVAVNFCQRVFGNTRIFACGKIELSGTGLFKIFSGILAAALDNECLKYFIFAEYLFRFLDIEIGE